MENLSVDRLADVSFQQLLGSRYLQPAFQPIVELASARTVGVEALARWPELGLTPDQAFEWAGRLGRMSELDAACRNAAIDTALAHGIPEHFALFVNLEPSAMTADSARQLTLRTRGELTLVAEITERALTTRPAELLQTIHGLSAAGCVVALDDVGAEPDSLALLPLIAPDVVKLDISLVRKWPDTRQGAILAAVSAYAERTGAIILAEGVEDEKDLEQALALGATLAQGWYFAHPGPLRDFEAPARVLFAPHSPVLTPSTPFSAVDSSKTHVAKKGLLVGISHHLESQGASLETPPVILSTFQKVERFTSPTLTRYSSLAQRCPLIAALGEGMTAEPAPGVRGVELSSDDPLVDEWVVAVVGTHYHGALIARDLGDEGSLADPDRHFSYIVTHDSDTVLAAARSLLQRVVPREPSSSRDQEFDTDNDAEATRRSREGWFHSQ